MFTVWTPSEFSYNDTIREAWKSASRFIRKGEKCAVIDWRGNNEPICIDKKTLEPFAPYVVEFTGVKEGRIVKEEERFNSISDALKKARFTLYALTVTKSTWFTVCLLKNVNDETRDLIWKAKG